MLSASCNAAENWQDILNSTARTSRGNLTVERDLSGYTVEIRLDGKPIPGLGQDYSDASLSDLVHVGGRELIIVALQSGGVACPTEFAVLELSARPRVSKIFGNCNPRLRFSAEGESLKIEMPAYFANPELLSAGEKRRLKNKVDTYVWAKGEIKSTRGER
jgi:hypothetical protein